MRNLFVGEPTINVLKGTTTVGVVCRDGIILATDTRATMGYFVASKRAKKIYRVDEHMAVTVAGVVGDAQTVVEVLKANASLYRFSYGRSMPIASAARLAANILFYARGAPLLMQAIIGGVDGSEASIYAIDPFGTLTREKCFSTGSGSPIAYGVLESQFRDGMSLKDAMPIVVKALSSAMKRDAASGDSFDVATVTESGYRELGEDEKKLLIAN